MKQFKKLINEAANKFGPEIAKAFKKAPDLVQVLTIKFKYQLEPDGNVLVTPSVDLKSTATSVMPTSQHRLFIENGEMTEVDPNDLPFDEE